MIGKSRKPRCFKNIKCFPTQYTSNKTAWMTSEIFKEWLTKWDKDLIRKNKKAVLFIDNCSAHSVFPLLTSLRLEFLPPVTTSKLQPMDAGIIKNFKLKYRSAVVENLNQKLDEGKTLVPITVLQSMWFTRKSWDDVSTSTIEHCFATCGFKNLDCGNEDEDADFEEYGSDS